MFLKLVCLCAVVACGAAMVCLPDVCARMDCQQLTAENCKGTIRPNGGFCGCCDACITEIAIGEKCLSLHLFGVPTTVQCVSGSFCDPATHTCRAVTDKRAASKCSDELAKVDARLAASHGMLLGLERPHCDADGNYAGMQFAGSQAYCVTKDGKSISGYMVNRWETGPDMNCQCARDMYAYMQTGLIGKLFHCDPNGNYANTQCTGSVCYCVDTQGKQVGTSSVNVGQLGTLNC